MSLFGEGMGRVTVCGGGGNILDGVSCRCGRRGGEGVDWRCGGLGALGRACGVESEGRAWVGRGGILASERRCGVEVLRCACDWRGRGGEWCDVGGRGGTVLSWRAHGGSDGSVSLRVTLSAAAIPRPSKRHADL